MLINRVMSDDTISKIKLRLNNNLKLKQSKTTKLAALNSRMSATDFSACNDFFANCCNCCNNCECCPCLSGFFIIVTGWEDGENCTCTGLNGGPVWAPRHTIDIDPTKTCDQAGQVPGFQTFGAYVCPPSTKNTSLEWTVFCENGKLWLSVVTNSNLSYSLGGTLSQGVIAELLIEVVDCDSLAVDEIVACQVGAGSPDCICPSGIRIQTFPVFGEQLPEPYPPLPDECLCCRPLRCEAEEPGCLNPYPDTLTFNFNDNCDGPSSTTLTRITDFGMGLCWTGSYSVVCVECEYGYNIGVMLCCDGGDWGLFFFPINNFDSIVWDNLFEGYGTKADSENLMYIDSCDPLSFHSDEGFCKTKVVNCPGPTEALYCITSFTIIE